MIPHKFSFVFTIGCMVMLWHVQLSAKEAPDWIEGEASSYPADKYITATASGSERERAKNRALAKLSRIFHVPDNETLGLQSNPLFVDSHDDSLIRKLELEKREQPMRDLLIRHARIAETWKDDDVFVYYALAVLDRDEATEQVQQELSLIDTDTANLLNDIKEKKDPLQAIAGLSRAIHLQQERLAISKMLLIINNSVTDSSSPYQLGELYTQLMQKIQSLHIGASVNNDPTGKLGELLRASMGNAGFPASTSVHDYMLVASLGMQDLGKRHGWYWMKGVLELKLVQSDGRVRGRKEWSIKVSALDHDDTENRLISQLSEKLDEEMKHVMIDFASASK